jgi:predicted PurR-regulated permease PerM
MPDDDHPPQPPPQRVALTTRSIAKIFFTLVALVAFVYVLYVVRSVVLLVFIAGFLAVALGPAVDFLSSRAHLPRAGAILLLYLCIVGAIVGVGLLVVPPVVEQVDQLAQDAPGYLADLRSNTTFREYDNKYDLTENLNEQASSLPSRLGDAAGALQAVTVGVFSAGVQLITVLTMTFFLLLDGRRFVDFAVGFRGPRREERLRPLAEEIYKSTAGYVAGALTLGTMAGVSAFVVLSILGTSFAVPLAVLMFFLDLVPLVGATIAGVLIAIVTAFTDFPTDLIIWVVFFLVYQQIENNVLQPFVYRRAVSVAPLLVIVSILVGSSLLGVLGALVAIPVAAAIQIIVRDLWAQGHIRGAPPDANTDADPQPADADPSGDARSGDAPPADAEPVDAEPADPPAASAPAGT